MADDDADQDRELTISEAADASGFARSTIRRALDADKFPGARKADDAYGTWLIPEGDLIDAGYPPRQGDATPEADADATPEVSTPPGALLVPREAWEQTLAQLANLHDAGERLADARERAAKAETRAEFLEDRLRELRAAQDQAAPDGEAWWWDHPVALALLAAVLAAALIAGAGWWLGWWS